MRMLVTSRQDRWANSSTLNRLPERRPVPENMPDLINMGQKERFVSSLGHPTGPLEKDVFLLRSPYCNGKNSVLPALRAPTTSW